LEGLAILGRTQEGKMRDAELKRRKRGKKKGKIVNPLPEVSCNSEFKGKVPKKLTKEGGEMSREGKR